MELLFLLSNFIRLCAYCVLGIKVVCHFFDKIFKYIQLFFVKNIQKILSFQVFYCSCLIHYLFAEFCYINLFNSFVSFSRFLSIFVIFGRSFRVSLQSCLWYVPLYWDITHKSSYCSMDKSLHPLALNDCAIDNFIFVPRWKILYGSPQVGLLLSATYFMVIL